MQSKITRNKQTATYKHINKSYSYETLAMKN